MKDIVYQIIQELVLCEIEAESYDFEEAMMDLRKVEKQLDKLRTMMIESKFEFDTRVKTGTNKKQER